MSTAVRTLLTSKSTDWWTPTPYVEASRRALGGGIGLDPASCARANETVRAGRYFDATIDGLTQDWPGSVFLNPPYGSLARIFIAHLLDQYARGITTEAIALLNGNAKETRWFQPLWDFPLCFVRGRIRFNTPPDVENKQRPTFGPVFAYLGPDRAAFVREFRGFGPIVQRVDRLESAA